MTDPRHRTVLPLLIAVLCLATHGMSAVAAESLEPVLNTLTNRPVASADLPDVTFPVLRVFGALGLVLALFAAGAWLFRHGSGLTSGRGRTLRLRVLETRHLGSRHALFVVGYDRQRLLVASSPAGITLLDRLPPEVLSPEDAVAAPSAQPLTPSLSHDAVTPTARLHPCPDRTNTESPSHGWVRASDQTPTFAEALRDLAPHS